MTSDNNQIKYLSKDFNPSSANKHLVDASGKGAKIFMDHKNGDLWFAKTTAWKHDYAATQLIGNKIYKHYLGKLISDDMLVMEHVFNKPTVWIASKQIKDFKTLNHVGDSCSEKEIVGIEKLHVIKILLNHWDQELNNLGLVIGNQHCFASGVDADGAFGTWDRASSITEPTFDPAKFNKAYNSLKKTYYMAHELKVVFAESQLERGFGVLYQQNSPDKFTVISKSSPRAESVKHQLDDTDLELKETILTQLYNKATSVILNNLDAAKLGIKDLPHYVKEYDSSINIKEMLASVNEVINTDHSVFRGIINSSLEEVRLYFDVVNRQPADYSYEQLGNIYFNYLIRNQEALKLVHDSIQQELYISGDCAHEDL